MSSSIQIEPSWYSALEEEWDRPYFSSLRSELVSMKKRGKVIYPPGSLIFQAFNQTPIDQVKVVILGQDPYHGPGQAMGLSFSVPRGIRVPASLKNIYKELQTDIPGFSVPHHGDLSGWAEQGVFLLNAILTVSHKSPGSHRHLGWTEFTDAVIRTLSERRSHVVFMLWGNFARSKRALIDPDRHLILEAAHPSPLARGAYFGSGHFSKANDYLQKHGMKPIDWQLDLL